MAAKKSPPTDPDNGSLEKTAALIRLRAYGYYEGRGCENGHALDDWLRAEAEIAGNKAGHSSAASETRQTTSVAA